jgi:imidazolonepropionase-like amidohydrolase
LNPVAIVNALVYTASDGRGVASVIERGTVLFEDGKIAAVGREVPVPPAPRS